MAMVITIFFYMGLLLLIEYKVLERIWKVIRLISVKSQGMSAETPTSAGYTREIKDVVDKMDQIKTKRS